jgi:hemerythrin-like domain-containing protein
MISDLARKVLFPDEAAPGLPDALALIKSDHDEASALFEQALDASLSSAARRSAIRQVCDALTLHAKMEEAIFYPALRQAGKAREKDSVLEAAEEHACVKDLIAKIKRVTGRDETLSAKVVVLKELVEHHVREEESEMFREAIEVLGRKIEPLGEEMRQFKARGGRGTLQNRKSVQKKTSFVSGRSATKKKATRVGR